MLAKFCTISTIYLACFTIFALCGGCLARQSNSELVAENLPTPEVTNLLPISPLATVEPTALALESHLAEATAPTAIVVEPTPSEAYLNLPVWARSDYEFHGGLYGSMLIRDFELTVHDNQPYRMSESPRPLTIFSFGYTSCPDICPLTLYYLKQAVADFSTEERQQIQVLFITVDPTRDTPKVLSKYMAAFDDDFIGLTGTEEEIQVVLNDYQAVAEKETGTDAENYLVSHTSRIYLVSPQQELMLQYSFDFEGEVAQALQKDLTYLLSIIN